MSLAVYIMRWPICYGWGPERARWYIAINRGNADSPRAHALPPAPLARIENQPMPRWQLALLYGFAGFGYISLNATYLPLMAKSTASRYYGAPLVVGRPAIIPGCFGWLWAAKHWGVLPCLTANLLIQSACKLLSRQRLIVAVNTEQYWFQRHVYKHNLAGDAACPTTQRRVILIC